MYIKYTLSKVQQVSEMLYRDLHCLNTQKVETLGGQIFVLGQVGRVGIQKKVVSNLTAV